MFLIKELELIKTAKSKYQVGTKILELTGRITTLMDELEIIQYVYWEKEDRLYMAGALVYKEGIWASILN